MTAAITGTSTIDVSTASRTDPSVSHTVPTGATLLLVSVGFRQNEILNGIDWNTSEAMTVVRLTDSSGDVSDVGVATFGLINPTATTANVDVDYASALNPDWVVISNWTGTVTSSVAAATNFISEDENIIGTNTTVLTTGGSAGNLMYAAAACVGDDASPGSESPVFTEITNTNTGGGSTGGADQSLFVGHIAAPSAVTITWLQTDENSGHLLEIVSAAVGGRIMSSLVNSGGLAGAGGIAGASGGLAG